MKQRVYGFDARVLQDHFPGIGRYAWNLLRHLTEQLEHNEQIVVWHEAGALNTRYDLAQLATPQVCLRPFPISLFGASGLIAAPRGGWGTIAHFPYFVRPLALGARSVTTLHDAIPLLFPHLLPNVRARLAAWMLHWLAVQRSTWVIVVSHSAANDLVRYFPNLRQKVCVFNEAPDPVFVPCQEQVAQRVLESYKLPSNFVLYLASNKPHKNLLRLVEAWRLVREALGDAHTPTLVIAGHTDPRYPDASQRARSLGLQGHVRFLGSVSDAVAAALYSTCRLFVFPSLYEGFGLTPLEAMACGAPVACSRTSSLPEVVGDAAILFNPYDVGDIAAACLRLLTDDALRAQMRERSLQRAALFRWEDTARQTLEVYREISSCGSFTSTKITSPSKAA